MNCNQCNTKIPNERYHMGYTTCVHCSTEEKVSCHTIYPHKTGAYIQVVSKEQSNNLNRLDRRGTGVAKTAKHYKPLTITKPKSKVFKDRICTKQYTTYEDALNIVSEYYDEWGYEPTLKYLHELNRSGTIPLLTRIKIQDKITDRYLKPSPRALMRKYN